MELVKNDDQATIVKYLQPNYVGIQLLSLSRCAIGYVVRGTKYIYDGDTRSSVSRGELFYMGVGNHYVEDVSEDGHSFEQVVVYLSPERIQSVLLHLSMNYTINVSATHMCERCRRLNHVAMGCTTSLRNLFAHIACDLRDDVHDVAAESLKVTELLYSIAVMDECCIRSKVLSNMDAAHGNFEQVIYNHIFCDISIDELASLCHRSLTSFKKEFKRHFSMPPHRWFIRQRLMRSRLLLISTTKSISEIGVECTFPNTSHFIKLFKKEYMLTPATYRHRYSNFVQSPPQEDVVDAFGA